MRSPRPWRLTLPVLLALAGACGGAGDGAEAAVTTDELGRTGTTCPVDLAGAAAEAGLEGGEVEVEVLRGSGDGGAEDSPIDRAGGVFVTCALPVDGAGTLTARVYAAGNAGAVDLLLPELQRDLDLATGDLEAVLDGILDTGEGDLADLGDDARAAVARLDVGGAESAVLYVSGDEASPDQVRAVATTLVAGL